MAWVAKMAVTNIDVGGVVTSVGVWGVVQRRGCLRSRSSLHVE